MPVVRWSAEWLRGAPVDQILDIKPSLTMVGGKIVHEAAAR